MRMKLNIFFYCTGQVMKPQTLNSFLEYINNIFPRQTATRLAYHKLPINKLRSIMITSYYLNRNQMENTNTVTTVKRCNFPVRLPLSCHEII